MNYFSSDLKVVGTRPIRPDGVDKVTGRAAFGADYVMPGMLWGKVKRSPHAHARIVKIDASKALALPGVKVVVTGADFPDIPTEEAFIGEGPVNFRDQAYNVIARGKALYEGHAVAAVAATSEALCDAALELIDVTYEVLPFVIDVEDAMKPDAPILHEDLFTAGIDPKPTKPSNVSKRVAFTKGNIEAGFAEAEVIVEGKWTTQPVHQAYIEPHACVCAVGADGQVNIISSSQGQFMVRAYTAKLLAMNISNIRATPAEIGGGFGGKTIVYLEPLAVLMSQKSGRPVKMVMTREEVFRASGPTSGGVIEVKLGAKKDGTITAARAVMSYQAGAFPGSPVQPGVMCCFAMYDVANVEAIGYDVVSNRAKVAAYRAPGAPISTFATESAMDDLARKLEMDPLTLREKNAAKNGTKTHYGPTLVNIGYMETLQAARSTEHYRTKLGKFQGRGVASGFWFNIGGEFGGGARGGGRHGGGGVGQSRYRRLARLDRHDGRRGAGCEGGCRADCGRRHGIRRLHPCDRWQPGDVCNRHGGDPGGRESGRAAQVACGADLGHSGRGSGMEGWPGGAGRVQRRRVRSVVDRGDCVEVGADRRADQRRGVAERARGGARLCHASVRR